MLLEVCVALMQPVNRLSFDSCCVFVREMLPEIILFFCVSHHKQHK